MARKKKNVEQAGQQAVPEGGKAVHADPVVSSEKPADPVSQPAGEPEAAPAGEHPAADPVAAVEGPAVDMGDASAGVITNGEGEKQEAVSEANGDEEGAAADVDAGGPADADKLHTHGIGDEGPGYRLKVRTGKARRAAWLAYHGALESVAGTGGAVDFKPDDPDWTEAGNYLLANSDAQPASIPVHLALQKLGGSMAASDQDVMLWGVFADTFRRVYNHLLAIDRAAEAAAPLPAGFGAGRAKAFKVEDPAFAPTGFSPRD